MTAQQHIYLHTTFTHNPPYNWQITKFVTLHHDTVKNVWLLTDSTPEQTMGDTDYVTIVYGSLGECLKYIHNNVRRLNK